MVYIETNTRSSIKYTFKHILPLLDEEHTHTYTHKSLHTNTHKHAHSDLLAVRLVDNTAEVVDGQVTQSELNAVRGNILVPSSTILPAPVNKYL